MSMFYKVLCWFVVDFTQLFYELISYVVRDQIGNDEVIQLLTEIVVSMHFVKFNM